MRCAWIVMLVIGCYEAPDYTDTHFRCDVDHACPSGQPCVNGICGGSGSGSGSNTMPDAPPPSTPVMCGATSCTTMQKCCADFVNGPSCIALSASCNGFAATCDGKEDCAGNPCCETGNGMIECAPSCPGNTICLDNADCPATMPQCCPPMTAFEPWGRCNLACP